MLLFNTNKNKLIIQKLIIRKFEKWKVCSSFKDNISGADLAERYLVNKCNKGFGFLCFINIFSNRSMKSWWQDNDIEIYSAQSERKSVVAERFNRTLKKKNYRHITSILKNVYIDKLAEIVDEWYLS